MGNGESISITHTRNASIKGARQLFSNNLLRVPRIKKNLASVSQFAKDNNVYFEFYLNCCLVRDIRIKEILLQCCCQGKICKKTKVL
jgi:hypothetical protein